jgi:hypothetical protein
VRPTVYRICNGGRVIERAGSVADANAGATANGNDEAVRLEINAPQEGRVCKRSVIQIVTPMSPACRRRICPATRA